MAEMIEITVEGRSIRYRCVGEGPVVLLLHCSSSHSGQWVPLIEALSPDFTVLAPDLHGYGRSDARPGDGRPYFVHDFAMVEHLVARFGAPVHLVGHSLGGTVALHLAVKRPELLASLTVIEPVQFNLLEETGAPEQAEFHEISTGVSALVGQNRLADAAEMFVDFWTGTGAYSAMDAKTRDYVEATIPLVADEWAGVSVGAPGQVKLADLAGIRTPCQILRGEATRASARAITDILHARIAGSELHQIPDVGHMAAASQPAAINPRIISFLQAQTVTEKRKRDVQSTAG